MFSRSYRSYRSYRSEDETDTKTAEPISRCLGGYFNSGNVLCATLRLWPGAFRPFYSHTASSCSFCSSASSRSYSSSSSLRRSSSSMPPPAAISASASSSMAFSSALV